jgi:hypothetical protein
MLEKIKEEEVEFMESLCDPVCLIESLFSDLDNLIICEENEFSNIRLAQLTLLSYEYLLDKNTKLSEKENFKLREGSGTVICFGGRKFGKTLMVEILDLLVSMIHNNGENCGFSSYDAMHIRGILEKVIQVLENHQFFSMYDARVNRSPTYRIFLKNGYCCESVNMNLQGENSGGQFYQKHFSRLYLEEASFETEEVYKKRLDSVSENGCIYRIAGMTTFTKYSPAGKMFYDLNNKSRLVNFPQYVNPKWDDKEKEKAVREHNGEDSLSYRVFVKGEVAEDGLSAMDMERVRRNYNDKKFIKHIEISKDEFSEFEYKLIIERPANCDNLYMATDVGESVSEIIIVSELNNKYKYLYNITCYNLTDKELFKIHRFLGTKLPANFISLDTTDGMGRAIFRSLEEVFPKENLSWCSFNEKIRISIEKDDNGKEIIKDGEPIWVEEFVDAWSIKRLRDLLYEENKFELPIDYKLDNQLNSIIATQSGKRTLYSCVAQEDHLLAAFRVFAIAEWLNYLTLVKPLRSKTFCKTVV